MSIVMCYFYLLALACGVTEKIPSKYRRVPLPPWGELRKQFEALPTPDALMRAICEEQLKLNRRALATTQEIIKDIEASKPL